MNNIEFSQLLPNLLKPILEQRFSGISGKQRIKSYSDRITFACPICGNGPTNNKRGNFILSGKFINFFKCHNCFSFMRIDEFFKTYGIQLELDAINYIGSTLQDFSSGVSVSDTDIELKIRK